MGRRLGAHGHADRARRGAALAGLDGPAQKGGAGHRRTRQGRGLLGREAARAVGSGGVGGHETKVAYADGETMYGAPRRAVRRRRRRPRSPTAPPGTRVAVRFSDGEDYAGTVGDARGRDASATTVQFADDGTSSDVNGFFVEDPDVRITRRPRRRRAGPGG